MYKDQFLVVIVLFKSSLEESDTFKTLVKCINQDGAGLVLFVYNNSPAYWSYDRNITYPDIDIIYVEDYSNPGVSAAYNAAHLQAEKMNKQFLLLLDQDTKLPLNFFSAFLRSFGKPENLNEDIYCPIIMDGKGILSPAKFKYLFTIEHFDHLKPGSYPLKNLAIINSGMFVSRRLLSAVGGYNPLIKLDFSDFDFLKRSQQHVNSVVIFDAVCEHHLSSQAAVPVETALKRFEYYLEGAKHYKKTGFEVVSIPAWALLRAFKLAMRYRNIGFLTKAMQRLQ
jgi:GT2 family glycosyltransferase